MSVASAIWPVCECSYSRIACMECGYEVGVQFGTQIYGEGRGGGRVNDLDI